MPKHIRHNATTQNQEPVSTSQRQRHIVLCRGRNSATFQRYCRQYAQLSRLAVLFSSRMDIGVTWKTLFVNYTALVHVIRVTYSRYDSNKQIDQENACP